MFDMSRPRLVTKEFLAVTAATAAFFVYVGMLVPLLPRFIEHELGAGELGIGLSVAMFALAAILIRPVIARIIEARGRRVVMIGGSLIAAAAGLAIATVDALGPLLAMRAIAGIGEAALFVGAATLVTDLAPPDRRAEAASYFSVAVFVGLGIGPLIGEFVLGEDRYHLAFLVAAGFAALAAVMSLAVTKAASKPTLAGPAPERRTGLARFVHPAALGPGLVLASGIAAFAVFVAFLPDHARSVGLAGSGGLFAAYSVVCLILRVAGARLPERLGPRRSVTIAFLAIAASLAGLAAFPYVWALWVSAVVIGVGAAFMYPSLIALAVNRADDRQRPAVVASFTMFFEIGTVCGGLVLGAFAELTSKRAAFAGSVLVCAFGLWLLRARVAPATEPDAPAVVPTPVFVPVAGD